MRCDRREAEILADRLFGLGASAVVESSVPGGRVELIADLAPAEVRRLRAEGLDLREIRQGPEPVHAWRAHARTWRAGPFLLRPPWVAPPGDGDDPGSSPGVEVLVDPETAFGSGSHPSTRLCLELLGRAGLPACAEVLDVGCGSGVLAVSSLLLGAAHAVGIDLDVRAVATSRRVAAANGVEHGFAGAACGPGAVHGCFDLVLANLLIPEIEEIGAELVAALAPGGSLIVGGFLEGQRDRAVAAVRPLRVRDQADEGDWWALRLTRST